MEFDPWTLGLQTVNVLVLLWLLQRFLFKPVSRILAQRQALAAERLTQADAARAAAEEKARSLEAERAGMAAEREKLLADARTAAQAERDALLARGAEEAARRAQEAQAAAARELAEAEAALTARGAHLAVDIARRLLRRLPGGALADAFLDDVCQAVAALPEARRRELREDAAEGGVRVALAAMPEPDWMQRCGERLAAALGGPVQVEPVEDPALVAGIELRFRHVVVRNTWAADLDRILGALDDGASPSTAAASVAAAGGA
ncbi:ATP synthase F0 subunit B [Pigmentiphaga soli]|uniref:ATP synthase subunit b n=1 Tax=Pigmentiphaga soli TaxID=1007095 RepID=A0ABP8HCV2_9BURK